MVKVAEIPFPKPLWVRLGRLL